LATLARRLGVADRVLFTGERSDTQQLYRAMDLYVSPSRSEGMSNTILEALASGVPVVGTAVGGTTELLKVAGAAGTSVPSEDPGALAQAITHSLDDGRELQGRGEAAREVACRRFSLTRMVDAYAALYHEVARTG
jgi:glycosyltransferase involved in cell wall biosynthesis